ncbi:MAG TPA: response regulator [Steroidobacteraceae bacterium]|nr:response regulator [Steroidobacteraceae bacterium]
MGQSEPLSDADGLQTSAQPGSRLHEATILVVDDDAAARLMLAAFIAPTGHRIVFATDAAELTGRLDRIRPDVIVCDLVMEEMRGDEFFRWLKADARWRWIPVLAVTRLDSPVVRADLLEAGADAVLAKPCHAQELRAWVTAAVRTRHAYLQLGAGLDLGPGQDPGAALDPAPEFDLGPELDLIAELADLTDARAGTPAAATALSL